MSTSESQSLGQQVAAHAHAQQAAAAAQQAAAAADPRDTAEYKAAIELELWKEQQEALFQAQVRGIVMKRPSS